MNDVVLTVEGLRVELDPSGADIDDEVTLSIRKGEVLGLVGESASGKTTAATALLNHERRGARIGGGNIMVDGRDILALRPAELRRVRGGLISYVPQDPSMSLNPALRIQMQLMEILEAHGFGSSSTDREERLREMMGRSCCPPTRVSGVVTPTSSPEGSSSAWPWPWLLPAVPPSSCSTSRRPAST